MVEKREFGTGELYRISDGSSYVDIVPWGASIRSICVPDKDGALRDVCLGYDSPEEYATQGGCLGAVVGRYANRISGAQFVLNGKTYTLEANEPPNTCHGGGIVGQAFQKRLWALAPQGEDSVVCTLEAADGDEGMPGAITVKVTYTWKDGALTIRYWAQSDADTVLNLTNHAYFNLAGQDGGEVADHLVSIRAERFTPIGSDKMVTGELLPVAGTPWDLRTPVALGQRWDDPALGGGFDHNYCLEPGSEPAAIVVCPRTGIQMELFTDRPGCQFYSAGNLKPRAGKAGAQYSPGTGLCLETQNYPNAVNIPAFPSPVLKAGEVFESETAYRFSLA